MRHLVTLAFPDDTMATFEAGVEVLGGGVGFLGHAVEFGQGVGDLELDGDDTGAGGVGVVGGYIGLQVEIQELEGD